ncbi:MAG TPA: NADH-quinone oxidoreductase subunit L [Solirubrobacteraceae bacterium]|nr:NADH-quinone oxidoreductase subunit L [Solirubrobacteraceae bacterium]
MQTSAWLILIFPLAGTLINAFGWRVLPGKACGWIGTAAIGAAFIAAVATFIALQDRAEDQKQVVFVAWDYANTVGVDGKISILIDPLSIFMALVVTGVSTLIHLYAVAYLWKDRGYARFFAYLNYFVFSMLLLVLAANFLLLIIGWAFVGAASYLLISFWYRRTTATTAGIKAFVINVVGDVGLVIGTFFIFRHSHTLDFLGTFDSASRDFAGHQGALTAGLIFLLVGAFAKSAQVPLHTWLPDAMEGPTPVSALIHAATMVTAGVYLIARMHPLFELSPAAETVGAVIGCVTLLIAGTIALAVTDLKRVIAYSTMSQIGYMVMGVSAGAYVAGLFHLMTHAFFKALLFMAAGSVISAMGGEQSMDRMSGFRRAMPFTFVAFIVGGLALAAVPPFSGFFSKDEILTDIGARGGLWWILVVGGYIGAILTAIYTWRMIFRTFWGDPCPEARDLEEGHLYHPEAPFNPSNGEIEDNDVGFPGPEHMIAERSGEMKIAMSVLAVLAIIGGLLQIPFVTDALGHFLDPTFADSNLDLSPSDGLVVVGLILGAGLSLLGIWIAYVVWVKRPGTSTAVRERLHPLYKLFVNKWYFDELINAIVVRPFAWAGRFGQQTFERVVVNGVFVGGTTGIVKAGSAAARALQNGFLRAYAALLVLGLVGVALYFLLQSS